MAVVRREVGEFRNLFAAAVEPVFSLKHRLAAMGYVKGSDLELQAIHADPPVVARGVALVVKIGRLLGEFRQSVSTP